MLRLIGLVVMLGSVFAIPSAAVRPSIAADEHDTPPVEAFIALVRGYDVATIRRTFPAYNTGLFERVFGAGTPIMLEDPHEQELFARQTVRTPAGVVIDIGHVITGLEAAAPLPPSAREVEILSGCSLRGSVTWAGDPGQGLIDFLRAPGATDPAPFYEGNAPPEDLLGDLDGYTLSVELGCPDIDVADVLTRAYLESDYEAHRFRRFLALLGDDPEAFVTRQVVCYARSFALLTGVPVESDRLNAAAPYFVGRFMTFLQAGLQAETGE